MPGPPGPAQSTAIILAGGHSRRMGRSKACLPFGDEPLLTRLVRIYLGWFGEVLVVAAPGQELPEAGVRVVRDAVPDRGPLEGICAGLRASGSATCFVASCDHPFPDQRVAAALVAALDRFEICAPRWEGHLQPLFAGYRRSVLPLAEAQLAAGELRPFQLFQRTRTRILESGDITALDPGGDSMLDVNDPETYRRALERLG